MPGNRWWTRTKALTFDAELDSQNLGEPLPVHFNVRWRRGNGYDKHNNPDAAIRDHIRCSAAKISAREPITRARITEDRINAALGVPQDICNKTIRILWARVYIEDIDSDLLGRAVEQERIRNEALQRVQQKQDEIRQIEAFRSRVLTDPGMALSYWFMHNPDKVSEKPYDAIEELSRKIALYDPNNRWVQISLILQSFIEGLTESERRQSIETLRMWISRHGMHELASRLPATDDDR